MVDFLITCLLRNALFCRSAVIRTFALAFSNCLQPTRTRRFPSKLSIKKRIFWSICVRPGFCSHIFAKLGSRPELVDFLLNCLLRNAFFVNLRSSGLLQSHFYNFGLAFSNFMQPTRTRPIPSKLSIKKRIFWSICGRPGFCGHIFAKLGSRPELVNFVLNCLLRNELFGRSAVVRTFAVTFLLILGNRLELVGFLLNCLLRNALLDLRSSGLLWAHFCKIGQPT